MTLRPQGPRTSCLLIRFHWSSGSMNGAVAPGTLSKEYRAVPLGKVINQVWRWRRGSSDLSFK